jgi:transcriptional regulator GlxA family with amidase domain
MPASYRSPNIHVSLVAIPEVSAAVLYGLHEVFLAVGKTWQLVTGTPTHAPQISVSVVAKSTALMRTNLGVPIKADRAFRDDDPTDIIVVADINLEPGVEFQGQWPEATAWLQEKYEQDTIICSVCTGAILLAEAELLNDRQATTHWSAKHLFQAYYPQVTLMPERVLLPTGSEHRVITSGGSASWTDLSLYLVARFCGQEEARRIAKLFLFGDRGDGQLPFCAMVRPKQHEDATVANCQLWVSDNYHLPNPVTEMIEQSGLTPRTFKRRFRKATGYDPLDYVQTLRMEEAKQMLEATNDSIDTIASSVGYEDPNSFRRLFKRTTAISPSRYRQRFQTVSIS